MSDNETGTNATNNGASFTERELQMLGWAMQSLKTGPPEIDYEKLAAFAGMSNPRSASNAWAKIKVKLITNPDGSAVATPKKAGTKSKKTAAAKDSDEDGATPKPKTTPRKRAAKKQEVEGEEASPKKKGRAAGKKKGAGGDDEAVEAESNEAQDLNPTTASAGVRAELAVVEENAEDES